jgi:hypothetical protein
MKTMGSEKNFLIAVTVAFAISGLLILTLSAPKNATFKVSGALHQDRSFVHIYVVAHAVIALSTIL